jgi:hypothetical protein
VIPTMCMYTVVAAEEQFQLWRRYYTSTDSATTTILAVGVGHTVGIHDNQI